MRGSGILMHISSLPSDYGIGTMGTAAYEFVDFLKRSGQKYWQLLPVGPTSYGDSPYQSFSSFAGNPYFIDFDLLAKDGLLNKSDYDKLNWGDDCENVDYAKIYESRFIVLKKAFKNGFDKDEKCFTEFARKNKHWLTDYAEYMAIKASFDQHSWKEWDEDIKLRKPKALAQYRAQLAEEINFWMYVQFLFFKQWHALKSYANANGIKIIGDIPIYVADDSADTWANPDVFWYDENRDPVCVAGCPPDFFSALGQLWGNPLYNWEYLKATGYKWWVERVAGVAELYDIVRIDHFRGFDSFYAIPYGSPDARVGEWLKGPGIEIFKAIKSKLGKVDIIAEDLGFITTSVRKLLKQSGYPGMKIMQFAFSPKEDSDFLPHNFTTKNCVVYTGTHDNKTMKGWLEGCGRAERTFARKYLHCTPAEGLVWAYIRGAWSSIADYAIAPMQDLLELGDEARMNTPSTLGGNWQWRAKKDYLSDKLEKRLHELTVLYRR